jgi:hypothetical protein
MVFSLALSPSMMPARILQGLAASSFKRINTNQKAKSMIGASCKTERGLK